MSAHLNHPKANLNAAEQAITAMEGAQSGEINEYSGVPIIVTDVPPRPVALPVKNIGAWYNPPTSHVGNAITTAHPTELAMLDLTF